MAYRIEYELQTLRKTTIRHRKTPNSIGKTVVIILVTVMLSYVLSLVLNWNAIGQADAFYTASEQLVQDLKAGSTFYEAVDTFCNGLIQ